MTFLIQRRLRRTTKRAVKKIFFHIRKKRANDPLSSRIDEKVRPSIPTVKVNRVLDWDHHDSSKQLNLVELCTRIVALAQAIAEKQFYPYQVEFSARVIESLLLHDGENTTALISRQSGKTEAVAALVSAIAVIFPQLAKDFPDDWKLNITDDKGRYRGYRNGVKIGIYAPRLEQSSIMFDRVKKAFDTDTGKKIMKELNLKLLEKNGDRLTLSNGSRILCQSASEQSKIEGETHHFLIAEEAQDIGDTKMRKSLHPMVSSLLGSIVKIGTASTRKCDFYTTIKNNERLEAITGKKYHFFYPYEITQQYNSLYRKYVESEARRMGEDSDEFRMSYGCEWIFERGMFLTQNQLFHNQIAMSDGLFSIRHPRGLHKKLSAYSVVLGIDWGSASDSTVVTTLAVDWKNPVESGDYADTKGYHQFIFYQKHILDWMEFIGDNYEYQFWRIMEYIQTVPNLKKIVMDSNTCGKPIFDRFVATLAGTGIEVVPFNFHANVKSDGYKSLYSDFCGHRITFPASAPVRATAAYRKFVTQMLDARKEYKNGLMCVAHPEEKGAHDDYCDSTMLAAWGANDPADATGIECTSGNYFFN